MLKNMLATFGSTDGSTSTTPDAIHTKGISQKTPGIARAPTANITIRLQMNPGNSSKIESA